MASNGKRLETKPAQRKRRAHHKSRLGCANCKLRSVKCDEARPCCSGCSMLGVRCVYGAKVTAETLYAGMCFSVGSLPSPSPSPPRSPPAPLPLVASTRPSEVFQLAPVDMELLEKFQYRTVRTLGSCETSQEYADQTLPLAFSNSVVMHAVLAYSRFHEILTSETPMAKTARDTYHWHKALVLLNDRLSKPLVPSERDALWMAAALITLGSVASTDAQTPSQAWPLRPTSVMDLAWMKICTGKQVVFDMTDPAREGGPFRESALEMTKVITHMREVASRPFDPRSLPTGLCEIFGLDGTPTDSPYYPVVAGLADLFQQDIDGRRNMSQTSLVWVLGGRFGELLFQRDDKAMLLLLYFYAKVCDRSIWWLWKHAWTEGLAVCEHLERVWVNEPKLLQLLCWPRMKLLITSERTVV